METQVTHLMASFIYNVQNRQLLRQKVGEWVPEAGEATAHGCCFVL